MIEFRPYQINLIQQVLDLIEQDKKRILIFLTMAGGKTAVMRGIVSGLEIKYGRLSSLVVVPFVNLIQQTKDIFNEIGLSVTIETYQEALSKGIRRFDLLFLDEAHHIGSNSWKKVPFLVKAKAIIGLSGTPYRLDNKPLLEENGGIFSDVLYGPSLEELTEQKYLARLHYFAYPLKKIITHIPGRYLATGGRDEITYEIDNKIDIVKEYRENFAEKSTIVFCKDFAHSKEISAKFKSQGIKADYLSCYRRRDENELVKSEMKDNILKVVCAVNMGSEGLDIPRLKTALLARIVVNSTSLFLQQIGRILRLHEDEEAYVLDLVGNLYRHGAPNLILKEKVIV